MYAPTDNSTSPRTGQAAYRAHRLGSNLVSTWARGRRQITPYAYPRLRALAAVRFAVGIFLVGLGAVMLSQGHPGWAVIPLAGSVLLFTIASLDFAAARSLPHRP
jgi:hypothetical protein